MIGEKGVPNKSNWKYIVWDWFLKISLGVYILNVDFCVLVSDSKLISSDFKKCGGVCRGCCNMINLEQMLWEP